MSLSGSDNVRVGDGCARQSLCLRGCVLAALLLTIPVSVDSITMPFDHHPLPCLGRDMLRFKTAKNDAEAVEIKFTGAIQKILSAAEFTHDQHGHACIVTAGKDGRHQRASKHYDNQALDFRTWHLTGQPNPCLKEEDCSPICKEILAGLKMRLGKDFDVLFEPDAYDTDGTQRRWQHIHAEHDPKS